MNANMFIRLAHKTHVWATFSPGHQCATPVLVTWGNGEEPPAGAAEILTAG